MSKSARDTQPIEIAVQVHPRSHHAKLGFVGDELHVWVTAPPVAGAANDAVIALLATTLGIPRRQVQLVRGTTARHKRVAITGIPSATLYAKLTEAP